MRPRISAAAFRVNVMARMFAGSTPRLSRLRYRSTSTCVLPVPADASSTTLCAGSTARSPRRRIGQRRSQIGIVPRSIAGDVSDDGRRTPVVLVERQPVRRRQRSPSGRRRRGRSGCTSSCPRASAETRRARSCRPHRAAASARRSSVASLVLPRASIGHELPILAKRDVAGLAGLPLLAAGLSQMLDRADGVDRQLQRQLAIGRAAQLVVDDAERAVLQQIDAIGFSAQRDAPGLGLRPNLELAVERMLQQPLDAPASPIRLRPETPLRRALRRRPIREAACAARPLRLRAASRAAARSPRRKSRAPAADSPA